MLVRIAVTAAVVAAAAMTAGCGASSGGKPAAAVTATTRTIPPTTSPAASVATEAADPISVVKSYIAAINKRDYAEAYRLGGKEFSTSYASFVQGFATTDHETLVVDGSTGDLVQITTTAFQNDGSQQRYAGTYTVKGGLIVAGNINKVVTGSPNGPGCGIAAVQSGTFNPACPEYQGYLDPGTRAGRAPTSGEIQQSYNCQHGYTTIGCG